MHGDDTVLGYHYDCRTAMHEGYTVVGGQKTPGYQGIMAAKGDLSVKFITGFRGNFSFLIAA